MAQQLLGQKVKVAGNDNVEVVFHACLRCKLIDLRRAIKHRAYITISY